jgi:hypothetical protein
MKKNINTIAASGVALGLLLLGACSTKTVLDESRDARGVPVWVSEGSNILKSKENRLFHGVGSAPGLGNLTLQTGAAAQQARAEIARIVASYMEIVSRDYIASGEAAEAGFTAQSVPKQIDNLSKVDLTGIRILSQWRDKDTQTVYAIAEMSLQSVRQRLKEADVLDQGLRSYIGQEGDNIFDRIAKTEDK